MTLTAERPIRPADESAKSHEPSTSAPVDEALAATVSTRCPFCRDAVRSAQAMTVCEGCLARHHASCWTESAACAACGERAALVSRWTSTRRRIVSVGVALGIALGVALGALGATTIGGASQPRSIHRFRAASAAWDYVEARLGVGTPLRDASFAEYAGLRSGSPAERAGLPRHGAIIAVNGHSTECVFDLAQELAALAEGEAATVTILSDEWRDDVARLEKTDSLHVGPDAR